MPITNYISLIIIPHSIANTQYRGKSVDIMYVLSVTSLKHVLQDDNVTLSSPIHIHLVIMEQETCFHKNVQSYLHFCTLMCGNDLPSLVSQREG